MPAVDLRGILTPIIGQVATLVFPDTVAIEEPVTTYDENNDPTSTWDTLDESPALIEPVSREMIQRAEGLQVVATDVTITLPGDRDIRSHYRLRALYVPPDDPDPRIGDRWDVVGVMRDPARATTIVIGRSREPGTPDEGS